MDKSTIYKFFEGTTSADENVSIYNWVQHSSENERILMHERVLYDAMIIGSSVDETKIDVKPEKQQLRANRFVRELLKVAAVAVITLLGAVSYKYWKADNTPAMTNIVAVPLGQRVKLKLSDGTEVWLNSQSSIEYPTIFTTESRKVKIEGEAYFDVAHNQNVPFKVYANQFEIEVLGTKFDVIADSKSGEFSTSLLEGSVKVNDSEMEKSVVLEVNEMVRLHDGKMKKMELIDLDQFSWRDGLIRFKDLKFSELMKRLEKCYGVEIIINNKKLDNYQCSGALRIDDGLDNALSVLQRDGKYSYRKSDDKLIIYID